MAVPIFSYDQFEERWTELRDRRRLFAFLLFDDRDSHRPVYDFAINQFSWLDSLAAAAEIFFFIFVDLESSRNPGLAIAKQFRISPTRMPGVVLFTLAEDNQSPSEGVYMPVKPEVFRDSKAGEAFFATLFEHIEVCQRQASTRQELIELIRGDLKRARRRAAWASVARAMAGRLTRLGAMTFDVLRSVKIAYGGLEVSFPRE